MAENISTITTDVDKARDLSAGMQEAADKLSQTAKVICGDIERFLSGITRG